MAGKEEIEDKGSIWRLWDLHIHTPASFHWEEKKYGDNEAENNSITDSMIQALIEAEPHVYAIMDYWHFDGWFKLKKRLSERGDILFNKVIFPGIELRLSNPKDGLRLNAHVIFSNEIDDQHLRDFLSKLRVTNLNDRPPSKSSFIEYARTLDRNTVKLKGYNYEDVMQNDACAYDLSLKTVEIDAGSYKSAIKSIPHELGIGFMPFDTNDGLKEIDYKKHFNFVSSIFDTSMIFESRKDDSLNAFAGKRTDSNASFFDAFQDCLRGKQRLGVSGSDAHRFKTSGQQRGYGDFPSGKKTWIKADPTWKGLLQAIKEPAERSYIGPRPPKLVHLENNKTFYIKSLEISKTPGSTTDNWLDGCFINFNPELVSIIGNKGSGKSALADIIGLLGNSKHSKTFSFLKKERFRGGNGEPAKHFKAKLTWENGISSELYLDRDPPQSNVEMVRYIPQVHFETLCNEHVSGQSTKFEQELRSVIYARIPEEEKMGSQTFEELAKIKEDAYNNEIEEYRKSLRIANQDIYDLEEIIYTNKEKTVQSQIDAKKEQLKSHDLNKPAEVDRPNDVATPEQQQLITQLEERRLIVNNISNSLEECIERLSNDTKRIAHIDNIRAKAKMLSMQAVKFLDDISELVNYVGYPIDKIVNISRSFSPINEDYMLSITSEINKSIDKNRTDHNSCEAELNKINSEMNDILDKIEGPQKSYQDYQHALAAWEEARRVITGSEGEPESLEGLKKQLDYIKSIPEILEKKYNTRQELTKEITKILNKIRKSRQSMYSHTQQYITRHSLMNHDYQIDFKSNLTARADDIASSVFDFISRRVGSLREDADSIERIKEMFDATNWEDEVAAVNFAEQVIQFLKNSHPNGIDGLLKKERSKKEFYDYIFGLGYIEPKYTLYFQNTPIEKLSPGQRGSLLLIFYLIVDDGRNPLVLDQPEENLDNETIVRLLVPVIRTAKSKRQIIMVTHNPNLAVVCDAEQIIHAKFDRADGCRMTYSSGSIENSEMNVHIVNVLEGTKVAFNTRRDKYQ